MKWVEGGWVDLSKMEVNPAASRVYVDVYSTWQDEVEVSAAVLCCVVFLWSKGK